ncbi:MAG: NrsF family protein [Pseudomonadota bacterium]|nr:NrsF family protein [Pseudomonadota bacterium]
MTNWIDIVPGGMQIGETARCFATVLLTSLPLSAVMFAMLRHAAGLGAASRATLAGSLVLAAMSASAMMLFHRLDASAMVLIWNLGVAFFIVALGAPYGRRLVSLRHW